MLRRRMHRLQDGWEPAGSRPRGQRDKHLVWWCCAAVHAVCECPGRLTASTKGRAVLLPQANPAHGCVGVVRGIFSHHYRVGNAVCLSGTFPVTGGVSCQSRAIPPCPWRCSVHRRSNGQVTIATIPNLFNYNEKNAMMVGMDNQPLTSTKRSTGRPRSQASHEAIVQAAAALLDSRPYGDISIEAIAAKAGVSKATIYRWWPNKVALVIEVLTEQALHMPQIPFDGRHLRKHLLACLKGGYRSLLRGRMTPVLLAVLAECRTDPAMLDLLYKSFFARLQAIGLRDLQKAVETGELAVDVRQDVLLDQLWGPLYYRTLIAGKPVDDEYLQSLLDNLACLN